MTTLRAEGEVSAESMGKTASSAVRSPPYAKPGPPRTTGNTADQNRQQPCREEPFDLWNELELESQKGNSRLDFDAMRGDAYALAHGAPAYAGKGAGRKINVSPCKNSDFASARAAQGTRYEDDRQRLRRLHPTFRVAGWPRLQDLQKLHQSLRPEARKPYMEAIGLAAQRACAIVDGAL